mmetsp:Transcript_13841/g.39782  ORF Transcript_13841/g.39782 Transcript_13841/m.39782 type:complete len:251 (+) Transcript_13841:1502-2254(+)
MYVTIINLRGSGIRIIVGIGSGIAIGGLLAQRLQQVDQLGIGLGSLGGTVHLATELLRHIVQLPQQRTSEAKYQLGRVNGVEVHGLVCSCISIAPASANSAKHNARLATRAATTTGTTAAAATTLHQSHPLGHGAQHVHPRHGLDLLNSEFGVHLVEQLDRLADHPPPHQRNARSVEEGHRRGVEGGEQPHPHQVGHLHHLEGGVGGRGGMGGHDVGGQRPVEGRREGEGQVGRSDGQVDRGDDGLVHHL